MKLKEKLICIQNNKTQMVERLERSKAEKLVATGEWTYTNKGAWKRQERRK